MRRLSVSLLFLASAFTFAQASSNHTSSNSPSGSPSTVINNSPSTEKAADSVILYADRLDNSGCPVGFSASRRATGQIMGAGDARQSGPAQGLHLTLDNHSTPAIESIEVKVHGTTPRGRVLPAEMPADTQSSDTAAVTVPLDRIDRRSRSTDTITKTFELHRTSADTSLREADVWMHQVGSLRWADLISVTYTDGTTWRATANLKCRAVPSNFLLVGSR
jgi:hypothetical protein